jgi:dihydroflavonol-4-reductase
VKRVVLTSSCGAIYYGHPPQAAPFDETSWTNIGGEMSAYVRSKAVVERAAWDFMAAEGGALDLSVINPAGIFGPVLGADFSSSISKTPPGRSRRVRNHRVDIRSRTPAWRSFWVR